MPEQAFWKEGLLTPAQLRERLHYDPVTGALTWAIQGSSCGGFRGKPAGCISKGYRVVTFSTPKVRVLAHRLIWAWMEGHWPQNKIDHRDREGLNNRWENLRQATQRQNMCNRAAKGRIPFKGVCYRKARGFYIARITVEGRLQYLGSFCDAESAARAYDRAAVHYHGEFSSTNVQLGLLEPEHA